MYTDDIDGALRRLHLEAKCCAPSSVVFLASTAQYRYKTRGIIFLVRLDGCTLSGIMLQPLRFFVKVIHQAPFNFTDHSTSAPFDDLNRIDGCTHSGPVVAVPAPDIVMMASDVISLDHSTAEGGGHEAIEMRPIEHASDGGNHSSSSAGGETHIPQPPSLTTEADHDDSLSIVGTEEYGDDGGLWRFEPMCPKSEDHYKRINHM